MISNERSQPYGRRPYQSYNSQSYKNGNSPNGNSYTYGQPKFAQPKPQVIEDTLKSVEIQVERKNFVLTLKENPRGRFLRITEDVGGRRDTIIIPSTGLLEFKKIIDEMVQTSEAIPIKIVAEEAQPRI